MHLAYEPEKPFYINAYQCTNIGVPFLILATRRRMTSVTVVPAEGGFTRTISTAPLSDGTQAC
jgi:hypothetical protein